MSDDISGIIFNDGETYERYMGVWSRKVGAIYAVIWAQWWGNGSLAGNSGRQYFLFNRPFTIYLA